MTEDEFLQQVREVALSYRWLAYHTHRSDRSDPGFPDLVLVKADRVIFAELKSPNGRLRTDQRTWLAALQGAGQEVALWRPADLPEVVAVLGPRGRRATLRLPKPSTR